jgi:uncharacterized protein (DUF4213/DUF364 family)
MMWTIQKRLTDLLKPNAQDRTISDVRIGLSYTAVRLNTGHAGVAWTPKSSTAGCTRLQNAGTLSGRPALEILAMLIDHQSSLARAVGLATANALLAAAPRKPTMEAEIISSLNIGPDDRVAMVGYFGPVVARLQKSGCQLDILELNSDHSMSTLSPKEGKAALSQCTVAIITGTTLINATFDDIAAGLGNHRAAVLLGPSSPLCDALFQGTGITHVAGSRVTNTDAILRIVSEGGGTMLMTRYLNFETVLTGER